MRDKLSLDDFEPARKVMEKMGLKHKAFAQFLKAHHIRVSYIGHKTRLVHMGDLNRVIKDSTI